MLFIGNTFSLTSQEQQAVLNLHNTYRQDLAQGKLKNGKGMMFPSTANMPKLVNFFYYTFYITLKNVFFFLTYDRALESIAQAWTDKCVYKHSTQKQRHGAGENIYYTSDVTISFSKCFFTLTN